MNETSIYIVVGHEFTHDYGEANYYGYAATKTAAQKFADSLTLVDDEYTDILEIQHWSSVEEPVNV